MFILQAEPRWTWPVVARVPADHGGYDERRFRATFRLLPKDMRDELGRTEAGTDELLRRAVVAIHDVEVEGAPGGRPGDAALLEVLLGIPWTRQALVRAWAEALTGVPSAAAAGN